MSALFLAKLRRLGVAQIRVRAIGSVTRARVTRLGVAFVRLSPVEIAIGAPPVASPSLDFSLASNSMYLGVI